MKNKRFKGRKRPFRGIFWAVLVAVLAAYLYLGNTLVTVTEMTVVHPEIPAGFDGYRIVQVSDLHNEAFGEGNSRLVAKLRGCDADCIVITGDIVDSRRPNADVAVTLAAQCAAIAPTYYVTGNHEESFADFPLLASEMEAAGVRVLRTEAVALTAGDDTITLVGADDPFMLPQHIGYGSNADRMAQALAEVMPQEGYTVLITHRPNLFATYAAAGADLTFTGHAHGGQIRLPLIGGIYVPDQGLFPEYTSGIYTMGDAQMVVSRGLGNSIFPLRVNNFPEVVAVTLKTA